MLYREDVRAGISPPNKTQHKKKRSKKELRTKRSTKNDNADGLVRLSRKRISSLDADPNSFIPHKRVPRQFDSFPMFSFPKFEAESKKRAREGSIDLQNQQGSSAKIISTEAGVGLGRGIKIIDDSEDIIQTDSQRLFPTFNPRRPAPHRNQGIRHGRGGRAFFAPAPSPPPPPGPRGGKSYNGHGLNGFRDFHETFPGSRGPGVREAIHRPQFAYPTYNNNEYAPVDNSLLGSGNFEVLSGGTFYDSDDLHLNHHPYDHYLDNSYVVFPAGHNAPPNNHVDDFFQNFRDFSEFAVRRSGSDQKEEYYEPGLGSEHIIHTVPLDTKVEQSSPQPVIIKNVPTKLPSSESNEDIKLTNNISKSTVNKKNLKSSSKSKHKMPRNIQEVIEDPDPIPSSKLNSILAMEEQDPMIAMF